MFEAYLTHLGRPLGAISMVGRGLGRTPLWEAYEAVREAWGGTDFWDVDPARIPELANLGFNAGMIALAVDEDESMVRPRMPRRT